MPVKCIQRLHLKLEDDVALDRRVLDQAEILVQIFIQPILTLYTRNIAERERASVSILFQVLIDKRRVAWLVDGSCAVRRQVEQSVDLGVSPVTWER